MNSKKETLVAVIVSIFSMVSVGFDDIARDDLL